MIARSRHGDARRERFLRDVEQTFRLDVDLANRNRYRAVGEVALIADADVYR